MTNLTHLVTHITLDMCGDTRKYLVSAKQGDKATRYIAAKLLNNSEEYIIPEDAKVVANMQKPDGKHVYNTCTYQDSEVLVELTNQMLAAAGTAYCDIEIRTEDDSQVITSVSFTIEIEKAIRNEKAILSSNEFTELDRRVKDIQDTEEMIKKAEEERASAENERASAEAGRDIAEGVRQGQEIARQESTEQTLQDVKNAIEAAQKATEECNDSILVIEEINATVDSNTGIPSVTVNTEGANSNKKFNFGFKNLKGETGQRGSQWYTGTAITGTNTTATIFSGSGITDAVINDYYLNTSTGCVYRCTESGTATVAKWVYEGSLNASAIADKANKDGNGNVISETYALKSMYGDSVVSVGRKADTNVGTKSAVVGGISNTASSEGSAVLGGDSNTANQYLTAVVGGTHNTASFDSSIVLGGHYNTASGAQSAVVGGFSNTASNFSSVSIGKYSKSMMTGGFSNNQIGDVLVVGNGTSNTNRSNALRVSYDGYVRGTQAFTSSGADYAEYIKEWADGNPDNEDRVGYMVTIRDGLLHKANEGDYIAGITSGNPSVVGNADEDYYWKYERDEFNRIIMEDAPEIIQQTDGEGNPMFDEETHEPIMVETGKIIPNARMKLADDYDSSLQKDYIERKDRKEWDYVGMVGVIPVRDDGTCLPDHYCKCGQDGIATLATERGFDTFYVIERISDNIVSIELR